MWGVNRGVVWVLAAVNYTFPLLTYIYGEGKGSNSGWGLMRTHDEDFRMIVPRSRNGDTVLVDPLSLVDFDVDFNFTRVAAK